MDQQAIVEELDDSVPSRVFCIRTWETVLSRHRKRSPSLLDSVAARLAVSRLDADPS
jgi:hypothetical protein